MGPLLRQGYGRASRSLELALNGCYANIRTHKFCSKVRIPGSRVSTTRIPGLFNKYDVGIDTQSGLYIFLKNPTIHARSWAYCQSFKEFTLRLGTNDIPLHQTFNNSIGLHGVFYKPVDFHISSVYILSFFIYVSLNPFQ